MLCEVHSNGFILCDTHNGGFILQCIEGQLWVGALECKESGCKCRDGFHSLGSLGLGFFCSFISASFIKILNVYELGPHSI